MSSTRREESSRHPSAKIPPKTKKGRRGQSRGVQGSAVSEHLSPLSKYLVKNEEGESKSHQSLSAEHTPTTTTKPSSSHEASPLTNAPVSEREKQSVESTELRTDTSAAELKPKSPKAVKKNQLKRGKGDGPREEGRGQRGNVGNSRTETKRPSGSRRRGGAGRDRRGRVGEPQDTEYAPSRREVQQSIRDHFPVRRSGRRCKSEIENELYEKTAHKLRTKDESGLEVVEVEGKGRGVKSTRHFVKGELICEYSGELISYEEAKRREEKYARDPSIGCYMYYFTHRTKKLCVDATADNGRMGRLLNHSRTASNVVTKLTEVDGQPYLCLIAARDISPGEELEYDYGERNKEALDSHPWLTT